MSTAPIVHKEPSWETSPSPQKGITAAGMGAISSTPSPRASGGGRESAKRRRDGTMVASACSRHHPSKVRVVFSGFKDRAGSEQWKSTLSYKQKLVGYMGELRGDVVNDMDKRVTHIIVAGGKKTTKSIGAVLMGMDVVNVDWVEESKKAGCFVHGLLCLFFLFYVELTFWLVYLSEDKFRVSGPFRNIQPKPLKGHTFYIRFLPKPKIVCPS